MECTVCKTPTTNCCSQCIHVHAYCSSECQEHDWSNHALACKPYITANDSIGVPALVAFQEKFEPTLVAECDKFLDSIILNLEAIGNHHGDLSVHKARIMLHEGTAHGHNLTDRQRRYFGWVAGGRKH